MRGGGGSAECFSEVLGEILGYPNVPGAIVFAEAADDRQPPLARPRSRTWAATPGRLTRAALDHKVPPPKRNTCS